MDAATAKDLRLLVNRVFESQKPAKLPDNTAQHPTGGNAPSFSAHEKSAARQEVLATFLEKYVRDIAEFGCFLSGQELEQERLGRTLAEQQTRLTALERQLDHREKEVGNRERNIFSRESGIVDRERAVSEREQAAVSVLEQLQKDKENARKEILNLLTSKYTEGGKSKDLAFHLWGSQSSVKKILEYGGNPLGGSGEGWVPLFGVVPRTPIQWSPLVKNTSLTIDATGLKATCDDKAATGTRPVVMGTQPLNRDQLYYELSVTKRSTNNDIIAIGLTSVLPQLNDRMPGWDANTWGYHGDDGKLFLGNSSSNCAFEKYTKGDVVGCGIDDQKQLFFTKNGKKFGQMPLQHISGPVWPLANISTGGEIVANFGPNFVYKF